MPIITVEAENSGYVDYYDGVSPYATVHDAATSSWTQNDVAFWVGQDYYGSNDYWLARAGLIFDTRAIPQGATVISVTLSLYGKDDDSDTDFDITLVDGSDLADTLVVADYGDLLDDTTSYGTVNTSGFSEEEWSEITLNATGLAVLQTAITAGTKIRFGLRSSRDISTTSPEIAAPTIETLRPNAAGDLTEFSPHPGTGEANWEDVDEAAPDEDSTYVYGGTKTDLYNLPNSGVGAGTIWGIKVYNRVRTVGSNSANHRIVIKSGGTQSEVHQGTILYGSWVTRSATWKNDPNTGVAWTWAAINALQIGVRFTPGVGSGPRCTQVYVEILYNGGDDNYESAEFYGSDTAGKKPKLTITFNKPRKGQVWIEDKALHCFDEYNDEKAFEAADSIICYEDEVVSHAGNMIHN